MIGTFHLIITKFTNVESMDRLLSFAVVVVVFHFLISTSGQIHYYLTHASRRNVRLFDLTIAHQACTA